MEDLIISAEEAIVRARTARQLRIQSLKHVNELIKDASAAGKNSVRVGAFNDQKLFRYLERRGYTVGDFFRDGYNTFFIISWSDPDPNAEI